METDEVRALRAQIKDLENIVRAQSEKSDSTVAKGLDFEQRIRAVKLLVAVVLIFITFLSIITVGYNLFVNANAVRPIETGSWLNDAFKNTTTQELKELSSFVEKFRSEAFKASSEEGSMAILKADLKIVTDRIGLIERSISDSPERALSIPLLRRDQEIMSKAIDDNRLAVSEELSRIYNQQTWMLSGIGAGLLTLFVALAGALFKLMSRPPNNS